MAERTMISWTDSTFNPVIGCTEVSPGCDNCYAREFAKAKFPAAKWGSGQVRYRTSVENWKHPKRWNRLLYFQCNACGHRQALTSKSERWMSCFHCGGEEWTETSRRVFCGSLCDILDNEWPDEIRADLWSMIASTPALTWLLLTKRIGNAATMAPYGFQSNVWIGATVCNQEEADRDIPKLLRVPAGRRFLSIEPMLGPITFRWAAWQPISRDAPTNHLDGLRALDWVIVGAESGPNRRPFDHAWLRRIVEQCREASVPVFVKQDSSLRPGSRGKIPDDLWVQEFPREKAGKEK